MPTHNHDDYQNHTTQVDTAHGHGFDGAAGPTIGSSQHFHASTSTLNPEAATFHNNNYDPNNVPMANMPSHPVAGHDSMSEGVPAQYEHAGFTQNDGSFGDWDAGAGYPQGPTSDYGGHGSTPDAEHHGGHVTHQNGGEVPGAVIPPASVVEEAAGFEGSTDWNMGGHSHGNGHSSTNWTNGGSTNW